MTTTGPAVQARPERKTMTIKELAELTGVCTNSLYSLAAKGKLPGLIRFGSRILISRAAVAKMLDEGWTPEEKSAAEGAKGEGAVVRGGG